MVTLSVDPEAHVVQFCSSKGKPCGIATYAEMFARTHNQPLVSSLKDLDALGDISITHLHVQHEFGLMKAKELQRIFVYCKERGIRCYVTMHTVVPLPKFPEYVRHRLSRPFRGKGYVLSLADIPMGIIKVGIHCFEDCLWMVHRMLGGRLRLWKRWNYLKRNVMRVLWKQEPPPPSDHKIYRRWIWDFENPDFDLGSFLHFRKTQKLILGHAAKILVHCDEARRALFAMGASQVECVPHGILLAPISSVLHSEKDGQLHVGCFGFLHPHKCLLEIIDACREIPNLQLHIYGSTAHTGLQKDYLHALREKMQKYPWIELHTDHLALEEAIEKLSRCDVNIWFANAPGGISVSGSIRQYLAAGRPIIASDTVMVSDVAHCMELVPPGNTDALTNALLHIDELKIGNVKRCAKNLSWENISVRYDQRDLNPKNISYPERMFTREEWMDKRYTFKKHILRMMNMDPFDRSIDFGAILAKHPEFVQNPLAAYKHSYTNGNSLASPTKKKIIYLHIQKTGGTTLTDIIRRNVRSLAFRRDFEGQHNVGATFLLKQLRKLPEREREMERRKWDHYDVFANHCLYGTHEFCISPHSYITMLRHPVDRLVSFYRFMLQQPEYNDEGDWSSGPCAASMSIREFIAFPLFRERMILGHMYVQVLSGTQDCTLTEEHLQKALAHLSTFEAVLITERFDESVQLLQALYGWKDQLMEADGTIVPREGRRTGTVTQSSNATSTLNAEEKRAVNEFLAFDIVLYDFAMQKFEEQLQEQVLKKSPSLHHSHPSKKEIDLAVRQTVSTGKLS